MTTVMLALNGEPIRMKNLTVAPSLKFQEKDQSGQTSSTATAEQGIKAKELKVSGLIPFKESKQLTRLFELAENLNKGGERVRYRVANPTAKAIKFRQAIFAGNIETTEQTNKMAWLVSFTLREQNSVSEKKEAHLTLPLSKQQLPDFVNQNAPKNNQEQHSWYYNALKYINDMIGPAVTAEDPDETTKNH